MDSKQKRQILALIYTTISFFSFLAIALTIYLSINKLLDATNGVLWLDITILLLCGLLLIYLLVDKITTKKMLNKFGLAKYFYTIMLLSIIGGIVLAVYCFVVKVDVLSYISYSLPLGLLFVVELVLIIDFVLGLNITRLHKNNTITVDSTSDVPNFDDEVLLKKKLGELNRKLEMKKIQEKINEIEKELDE